MKYSEFLNQEMLYLASKPETVFIGYNLANGSQGYGTLKGVPRERIMEMPIAEQSMTGIAIGMALNGFVPVLFFERHDFLLLASDQIINHLAKINKLSHSNFNPRVIIRAVIGTDKPLSPGIQHLGNYTELFIPHIEVHDAFPQNADAYRHATSRPYPVMIVESRGNYSEDVNKNYTPGIIV